MIRVGIIGGADKIAGELISILINHPDVEIAWVNATNANSNLVSDMHPQLFGETYMRFTDKANFDEIDALFLCIPDGRSRALMASAIIPERVRIIDLSSDFRINGADYGFVYGLPELNRKAMVRGAKRVAVPSAMATAIELSLLPLAKNLLINDEIISAAVTATTDPTTITAPLGHQQANEIIAALQALQSSFNSVIRLMPIRGAQQRGVNTVTYIKCALDLDEVIRIYEDFYADHSFTFVSPRIPHINDVFNTNKCLLNIAKADDRLVISTVIDNLVKGSAGQAVHDMNLLFGLQERVGLTLKSPSA